MKRLDTYIWQKANWHHFRWDAAELLPLISKARAVQSKLSVKVSNLGFDLTNQANAVLLTEEVIKTSEIEGEKLNRDSVRSSVARHLGLPLFGLASANRSIDGLVEVLLDATMNYQKPLTPERLKAWQAALFPTGFSGLMKIRVGEWREADEEPMQIVSGPFGKETVHYEAVPGSRVRLEVRKFLAWWESSLNKDEGLIRAAIAHFYFVTIHPFEDGNGRIARAITDMALAQDEKLTTRLYSLSSQITKERNNYYSVLERCQKGDGEITEWLRWFLECLIQAVEEATHIISKILAKKDFWTHFATLSLSERQKKVINVLLDVGEGNFVGGLTTRKYVSIAKVSRTTAFREISDLLEKRVLKENPSKGRSVSYELNWDF